MRPDVVVIRPKAFYNAIICLFILYQVKLMLNEFEYVPHTCKIEHCNEMFIIVSCNNIYQVIKIIKYDCNINKTQCYIYNDNIKLDIDYRPLLSILMLIFSLK